jgi:hypothetical protein
MFHLVVKSPFAHYPVGYEITDPAEVERVLASHNEAHVVKRAVPAVVPQAAPLAAPAEAFADHEPDLHHG